MAVTTEIAPNIYRISIFAQWGNLQFNHFLVKDDEPLLFHTGLRGMHAEIREAVSKLINLSELRHIGFSPFWYSHSRKERYSMKARAICSFRSGRARFAVAILIVAALGWMISPVLAAAQTAPMPKKSVETYYFLVFSNPVPGTEDEYNKWYTEQHQLDVVSIPGFMTAQRYVVSENQLRMSKPLPKYLMSYKIVTDDLPSVFQEVHRRLQTGETKMSPTFDGKTSVSFTYKAIQPVIYHKGDQPKPIGGETHTYAQIVFSNPTTPAQEDEYNRWYRDQHLPDVVSAPGFVHAQRFVLSNVQSTSNTQWPYKYLAMFEIVSDDWPTRILDFKRIGPTQSKSDVMGPSLGYTYTVLGPMIDGDKVRADRAAKKLRSQK